ncbi:hypothetical protein [Streptosporangium sp. G12]
MAEPSLPPEALRAAESAIRDHVRIHPGPRALAHASEGQPIMLSGMEAEAAARAALEAAAPFLAEHIALVLEARGDAIALDCWCYDTAADLAREAFPKETSRDT